MDNRIFINLKLTIRIIIYQKNDPLCAVREGTYKEKLLSIVRASDIHMTNHVVENSKEHKSDLMAIGLAEYGSSQNAALAQVIAATRKAK